MRKSTNSNLDIPEDLYKAQVDSLFGDIGSLFVGSLAASAAPIYVALESGRHSIALLSLALSLLAGARIIAAKYYFLKKATIQTNSALRAWEVSYIVGSCAHVTLLGVFCILVFMSVDDGFARVASFSITIAYLVGIPGRNFANNNLVNSLILCALLPMFAALILAGGYYWLIGIFTLLPFFIAMRSISLRLRGVYLDAVVKARDVTTLAGRFDSALNNMPCGLAMVDKNGDVIVTNRRLRELLDIQIAPDDKTVKFSNILLQRVKSGVFSAKNARDIAKLIQQVSAGGNTDTNLKTPAGRVINISMQQMNEGGAVVLFEDVTERSIAQERIHELAHYDPLTGLPNRMEFREKASSVLSNQASPPFTAIMFLDLDQFKQVNDTLGHALGDQLLIAVAGRLRNRISTHDLVGRLGGDEFVILLNQVESRDEVADAARAIIHDLSEPYELGRYHVVVGASIGIAMSSETDGDIESLLRRADMALYQAKADGRGTWRFFEHVMELNALTRRNLEFDLRHALDNDELELHFQPIYNLALKRFSGCEALVRWNHPTRGIVPPSVFVPIAEEVGLIFQLDDWVLNNACLACAEWAPEVRVAINISAVHFRDGRIVLAVQSALKMSGLAPHRLEIEMTETAVLHNMQATSVILHQLRELGVQIALDDFGTGYSSLSYLHTLPLTKLKVDSSFLVGLEDGSRALTLLGSVTQLGKSIGLSIVVEGVETAQQLRLVTTCTSIDEIQGYIFSKPIKRSAIAAIFAKQQRSAA
jgi:diguanylate cyclase (GGDEF)-like protein